MVLGLKGPSLPEEEGPNTPIWQRVCGVQSLVGAVPYGILSLIGIRSASMDLIPEAKLASLRRTRGIYRRQDVM